MIGKVRVVTDEEFSNWLAENTVVSDLPPVELGKELYTSKACFTCHTLDGSPSVGPTFLGIFGRSETLSDGTPIVVDENYLRESILEPQAKIVEGFQPVMPTYQGILKDEEIDALIAFLKEKK
jgi:cytochrome c oxidase subunit 2